MTRASNCTTLQAVVDPVVSNAVRKMADDSGVPISRVARIFITKGLRASLGETEQDDLVQAILKAGLAPNELQARHLADLLK